MIYSNIEGVYCNGGKENADHTVTDTTEIRIFSKNMIVISFRQSMILLLTMHKKIYALKNASIETANKLEKCLFFTLYDVCL